MHTYLSTDVSIILKITRKSKSLSETTTRNQTKKQVRKTMCFLCYSTSEASCAVVQTGRHTLRLCPGPAAVCSLAALLRMACVPCSSLALSLWFLLLSVSLGFDDDISSALISISMVCAGPCLYFSLLSSWILKSSL